MILSALILTDQNNAIGKNHHVIDHLPAYVKYFEKLTKGSPVIMGRKTFESLGHLLVSKKNIIITRNEKYHSSRARTFHSFSSAINKCKNEKKVFVIGGVGIFNEALPYTSVIYRTAIMARFKSDNYYPDIDANEFEIEDSVCIQRDEKNRFDYCVEKWVRSNGKGKKLSED